MGMFDYVECDHPLPDGFNPTGVEFQTKDLFCELATIRITEAGRLEDVGGSQGRKETLDDWHGDLEFYCANVCGGGPHGFMTEGDKPLVARHYDARFTDGRLSKIEGGDTSHHWAGKKHLTREEWYKLLGSSSGRG